MAGQFNVDGSISIPYGDSLTASVQLLSSSNPNVPFDLTGFTVSFDIGSALNSASPPLLQFKAGAGIPGGATNPHFTISNASSGLLAFDLTVLDINLSAGGYWYAFHVTNPSIPTFSTTIGPFKLLILPNV